ncbi:MAG: peptidylprolyl isomerase [Gemmatimonadota bacterium]|nr:peptidylprolyl isomerase [Gemmatimonadota bacterium]MDH4347693.1 peptidylprolyl isomerase [Gemmatimonadota bacterium]
MNRTFLLLGALLAALGRVAPLSAQGGAEVEMLANLLAAEDSRSYDEELLRRAMADPDSTVRRYAAMAAGRIGDPAAVPLLAPLLADTDTAVQVTAIFALGLLRDTSALAPLSRRARDQAWLASPAAFELVAAAARIGGEGGTTLIRDVMRRSVLGDRPDSPYLAARAALEAWRLGPLAPVEDLLGMVQDPKIDVRLGAVYSLGRIRSGAAVPRLLDALSDRESPLVRAAATRGLVYPAVRESKADPAATADRLVRAANDEDPGVRISALRALSTYPEIPQGAKLLSLLEDVHSNVQVQAAQTLGGVAGPDVAEALSRVVESEKGSWGRRYAAFLALARQDTAAFGRLAASWTVHGDWRRRAAAATGFGLFDGRRAAALMADSDPRVATAALAAWREGAPAGDADLLATGRQRLGAPDAAVRSVAAGIIGAAGDESDIPRLVAAVRRAARDSFPDAADSALGAIAAIAGRSVDPQMAEQGALAALPEPESYLVRQWAEIYWPAAAAAWGSAYPVEADRTMQDYRELVQRFVVGVGPARYPRVIIEVEQVGRLEVELFGPEAPLTVANFLRLVDRRYFDGQRFHRVVPNFVAQTGDPRGDGWGGPGTVLRDEINLRRYKAFVLGMALSGPNTGASQWFITLSQQPHLDGSFTAFGEVVDGLPVLQRVTQGDQIRSIRRQ